jgi:hypothetical protein
MASDSQSLHLASWPLLDNGHVRFDILSLYSNNLYKYQRHTMHLTKKKVNVFNQLSPGTQ